MNSLKFCVFPAVGVSGGELLNRQSHSRVLVKTDVGSRWAEHGRVVVDVIDVDGHCCGGRRINAGRHRDTEAQRVVGGRVVIKHLQFNIRVIQ